MYTLTCTNHVLYYFKVICIIIYSIASILEALFRISSVLALTMLSINAKRSRPCSSTVNWHVRLSQLQQPYAQPHAQPFTQPSAQLYAQPYFTAPSSSTQWCSCLMLYSDTLPGCAPSTLSGCIMGFNQQKSQGEGTPRRILGPKQLL